MGPRSNNVIVDLLGGRGRGRVALSRYILVATICPWRRDRNVGVAAAFRLQKSRCQRTWLVLDGEIPRHQLAKTLYMCFFSSVPPDVRRGGD